MCSEFLYCLKLPLRDLYNIIGEKHLQFNHWPDNKITKPAFLNLKYLDCRLVPIADREQPRANLFEERQLPAIDHLILTVEGAHPR